MGLGRLTCLALAMPLVPSGSLFSAQDPQEFSEWSAPVNLGPPVNTIFAEIAPFISRDGLSLYHVRTAAAGGFGGQDIWVSGRATTSDLWGPPENLGSTINTSFNEFGPSLSPDGHRLYFESNRPGFAGSDLYVSRRHNKRDDLGWQPPVNLGSGLNTAANELNAAHFEDDLTGIISLYFASNRQGGPGEMTSTSAPSLPTRPSARRSWWENSARPSRHTAVHPARRPGNVPGVQSAGFPRRT